MSVACWVIGAITAIGAIACGPGLVQRDPRTAARDAVTAAAHDVGAMTQLVQGPIVNGGLWFADPACRSQFSGGGEVPPARRAAFARCLVDLGLTASPREDALGDVVVLTYAPGFEVEARIKQEPGGPRALAWIGFAAKRERDVLPTISGAALEGLRLAGDRDGAIEATVGDQLLDDLDRRPGAEPETTIALAWIRLCLDADGAITEVEPFVTSSPAAEAAFVAAARQWKFRPFAIDGRTMPVCAMARLTYPPAATTPEVLPLPPPPSRRSKRPRPLVLTTPHLLQGKRIAGNRNLAPDDRTKGAIHKAGLTRLEGRFRLCIDDQGVVESVLPMRSTGVASYDERLIAGIRTWRYSPYLVDDQPVPVCTHVVFVYHQEDRW